LVNEKINKKWDIVFDEKINKKWDIVFDEGWGCLHGFLVCFTNISLFAS